jgi:hypothetical protein
LVTHLIQWSIQTQKYHPNHLDSCWYNFNSGENTSLPGCGNTTLTANGGTLGTNAVNLWYRGGYGGDAYDNGWDATTAITESIQSVTNNNNNGILNVTAKDKVTG